MSAETTSEVSGGQASVAPKPSLDRGLYGIQLTAVHVREVFIRAFRPLAPGETFGDAKATITANRSDFLPEGRVIVIGVRVAVGGEEDPTEEQVEAGTLPFRACVHLHGEFRVGPSFPEDRLPEWAYHNAPILLYPYLREQFYSLTSRLGIAPYILPMVEIPTVKLVIQESTGEVIG